MQEHTLLCPGTAVQESSRLILEGGHSWASREPAWSIQGQTLNFKFKEKTWMQLTEPLIILHLLSW